MPRDYGKALDWYNMGRVLGQDVPLRDLRPDISREEPAPPGERMLADAARMEAQGKGSDAVRVYTSAASLGNAKAALRLALIYGQGIPGVEGDYAEYEKWAKAARRETGQPSPQVTAALPPPSGPDTLPAGRGSGARRKGRRRSKCLCARRALGQRRSGAAPRADL